MNNLRKWLFSIAMFVSVAGFSGQTQYAAYVIGLKGQTEWVTSKKVGKGKITALFKLSNAYSDDSGAANCFTTYSPNFILTSNSLVKVAFDQNSRHIISVGQAYSNIYLPKKSPDSGKKSFTSTG